jgi:hypothetical protein
MPRGLSEKAEIGIIVILAFIPLFIQLPYRVNIFLSWEGAYRMSEGQLPFRDFGIPLGGMYWAVPALFFKVFGPKLVTLVKAQVFLNIVSGLAFRSVLGSLSVNRGVRLASVVLFCISYSFFNFWPWYNHSVIVYELVGLAFLLKFCHSSGARYQRLIWLAAAALFLCCSFLTKQDGGGMAFVIALVLIAAHCVYSGNWSPLVVFSICYAAILFLLISPFLQYGFGYWFNHGQPPHTARVSVYDIAGEFLGASQWIKFYFVLTLLLAAVRYRNLAAIRADRSTVMLVLLTWGILWEAAIFQVTSYTPPDNNIFFHSFGFVCVVSLLAPLLPIDLGRPRVMLAVTAGVLLWWSGTWWKYSERLLARIAPPRQMNLSEGGENVVNRSTFMLNHDSSGDVPMEQWVECGLPTFTGVRMPLPTAEGIGRLMKYLGPLKEVVAHETNRTELRVLNMSELTPLAVEIPYQPERNPELPLWYHLGVGMFNRQADTLENRISHHYYDLVLFEYVPTLNNFYPFRVRDSLRLHYRQVDSFMAPRRGAETMGTIEVYVK